MHAADACHSRKLQAPPSAAAHCLQLRRLLEAGDVDGGLDMLRSIYPEMLQVREQLTTLGPHALP